MHDEAATDGGGGGGVAFEIVATKLGVRLTTEELIVLKEKFDINGDGLFSHDELHTPALVAIEERSAKELFLSVVETPITAADRIGSKVITLLDYTGTALFAIVGTQVAGNVGMNIIGCGLVGCVAALGGGTLNSIFYGVSSPLLFGQPGVFWARNYKYLAVALSASIVTFFGWPAYCHSQAESYVDDAIGKENLHQDGSVSKRVFIDACRRNNKFMETLTIAFPEETSGMDNPECFFNRLDTNQSGTIDIQSLEALAQKKFDNSVETYVLDSAALGAFSICAVHGAISAGLHPLVAATSGVTICFGGLFRDVFCNRDLAIAGQSYALATGAGSTVYVLLRELTLRGIQLSSLSRIILSLGTCVGLRAWEYIRGAPLLKPMHSQRDQKIDLVVEGKL